MKDASEGLHRRIPRFFFYQPSDEVEKGCDVIFFSKKWKIIGMEFLITNLSKYLKIEMSGVPQGAKLNWQMNIVLSSYQKMHI